MKGLSGVSRGWGWGGGAGGSVQSCTLKVKL